MSTCRLLPVSVALRANCTPVTAVPPVRNSLRTLYSPSTPSVDVPARRVRRMNDLLVSTAVPSVTRFVSPLMAPEAVGQAGLAPDPPMQEAPRCTVAPSYSTTCQATVTVVLFRPTVRVSCSVLVVPVVHGFAPVASSARIVQISSREVELSVLRCESSTKLFVQSTAVSVGVAVGVVLVPLKTAIPRWTDTPASNSTT